MKILTLAALLLIGCATTSAGISPDYNNPGPCPSNMDEEQKRSGFVQCRAECASWGRDIVEFDDSCRCICTQPVKPSSPSPKLPPAPKPDYSHQS